MINYQHLQEIVSRFPSLMKLDCEVYPNKVKVIIRDEKDRSIIYKEMTVEGVFENDQQIEHIKNQCSFDIVCHLCLTSYGNIKNQMIRSQDKTNKTQLN